MAGKRANRWRVRCDIHGWLETHMNSSVFGTLDAAKAFHNVIASGPGHDPDNCRIDVEESVDGGATWKAVV